MLRPNFSARFVTMSMSTYDDPMNISSPNNQTRPTIYNLDKLCNRKCVQFDRLGRSNCIISAFFFCISMICGLCNKCPNPADKTVAFINGTQSESMTIATTQMFTKRKRFLCEFEILICSEFVEINFNTKVNYLAFPTMKK